MQQKNLILFIVLTAFILLGWVSLNQYLWPPPPPKEAEVAQTEDKDKDKEDKAKKDGDKNKAAKKKKDEIALDPVDADLRRFEPTKLRELVSLGESRSDSRFHMFVEIDPRSAGVRGLLLNKFQAASDQGRPVWIGFNKKKHPLPLALLPFGPNSLSPSFQLLAYDVADDRDDKPLDTLARVEWKVVPSTQPSKNKVSACATLLLQNRPLAALGWSNYLSSLFKKTEEELADGRRRQSVSLQAESQGVIITKTYTLTEGEYHLGLSVKMRRKEGAAKNISFRYQLTGGHGLPVEGKWYTSTFRNALMARVDKDGVVYRDLQTLQQIERWAGGNEIRREDNASIVFAGSANQYFASMIVVDDTQKKKDFLRHARPTLEIALTKGEVVSVAEEDHSSFVLRVDKDHEETFYVPKENRQLPAFITLKAGLHVAVRHYTGSYIDKLGYPEFATDVFPADSKPAVWVDDITVRLSTEPVELSGDEEVEHQYLLYNGPVKVSQLFPPPGLSVKSLEEGGVSPELQKRYHDDLHLNTLTDYHSPGPVGTFSDAIYWTNLVVWCTNLMHRVLAYLHACYIPYGLCIIVLTLLVRGMMFPLSRKQALMSLRMQQLQPELKKLQEKHKGDRQALGMAQMELYRKHGVNPFGSCWVVLLQMPIFMGLYYALQESIHFRLAECWPWIVNLSAPDMLVDWTQRIPFISRVEDYGSFLYLGPYFNLLPVIAVVLMIGQQKMMTPPPADEQQAMQQKMMKYMMVFFGLMFYKIASGLCLYFIASSAWGFCERKMLPKKKVEASDPSSESYLQKLVRKAPSEAATVGGGRRGRGKRRRGSNVAVEDNSLMGRWRKRMHEWWTAVLKEAEKKNRS